MFLLQKLLCFQFYVARQLQKKIGESEKELKSRELKHKFEQYKGLFNFVLKKLFIIQMPKKCHKGNKTKIL